MATMLVVAAIALTVTPIFVVNAFRLLATDTFVRHEIDRSGFPADRYGLTTAERRRLALTGLHSILPGSDGIALLERATLPDGSAAFDSRELRHMRDVRSRLGAAYTSAARRARRPPRPRDRAAGARSAGAPSCRGGCCSAPCSRSALRLPPCR